jgi:aminoglycoside phosphotransferase (APT) family kinase protein
VYPRETIDVLDTHRFDAGALARYLRSHLAALTSPLVVREFRGGQSNPTYYIESSTSRFVLRRKPPGQLLPSAHAIEREYQVMTALRGSGVPVPNTYLLCEDPGVIGTPFFLMEYVEGHPMTDATLPGDSPADRAGIYRSMIEILARLHTVDWRAAGLADYGKPGNYVARQVHRWTSQYRASETERIDAMERLIAWLPAHIPADEAAAIVHGDYRPGNLLLHPTEPVVAAVIDWELATVGPAGIDLGHWLFMDEFHAEASGFERLAGYPDAAAVIRHHERVAGRPIADLGYFELRSALLMATTIIRQADLRVARGELSPDTGLGLGNVCTQYLARRLGLPVPALSDDWLAHRGLRRPVEGAPA